MTTLEILSAFLKGNELTPISEKQKSWLLSQARKERVSLGNDGFNDYIYLSDCHYQIRSCKTHVAGYGGTRGTRVVQGRYILERMYTIRFDSTGLVNVCRNTDIKHYQSQGLSFTITNQLQPA